MIKQRLMRPVKVFYLTKWIRGTLVEVLESRSGKNYGKVVAGNDYRWFSMDEVIDDEADGDSLPVQ